MLQGRGLPGFKQKLFFLFHHPKQITRIPNGPGPGLGYGIADEEIQPNIIGGCLEIKNAMNVIGGLMIIFGPPFFYKYVETFSWNRSLVAILYMQGRDPV